MSFAATLPIPAFGTGRSRIIERLIDLVVLAWLFFLSDATIPLVMLGEQTDFTDQQKLFFQNIFKPYVLIAFGLLILHFRAMTTILLKNPLLILIVIWMWISSAWSLDPEVTFKRSLLQSSFLLMACFVAYRYDFRQIIALLFLVTVAVLACSFYFIILDPFLGFNPDGRGARGAFLHKNTLGNFIVVGIAVAGSAIRQRIVPRPVGYAVLAAAITLLIMANSTTSMLVAGLMFGVFIIVLLKERLSFRLFAALVAFIAATLIFGVMLLIANIDEFFLTIGRDATLTGRDVIWSYVLRMIQERPFLGYGYSAFWETEPIVSYVTDTLQWSITHAHSGYLEMWLELGLIGMGFMVAFLIVTVFRAGFRPLPDHAMVFILPFFTAMIVNDLVETHLFVYKHFGWIVMLVFVFVTTPGLARIRRRCGARTDFTDRDRASSRSAHI